MEFVIIFKRIHILIMLFILDNQFIVYRGYKHDILMHYFLLF